MFSLVCLFSLRPLKSPFLLSSLILRPIKEPFFFFSALILIRTEHSTHLFQDHFRPLFSSFSQPRKPAPEKKQFQLKRTHRFFWQFKRNPGGLFCPPVFKVKAEIYFLSPKIQIYVFLLPASEKGLGKEKHGLTIKCKRKMNEIFWKSVVNRKSFSWSMLIYILIVFLFALR